MANAAEAGLLLVLFLSAAAFSMLPVTRSLILLWGSDPLRSFGMLVPLVAIVLMVRAWRGTGWQMDPNPLGLAAVIAAVLMARASEGLFLTYRLGSSVFYLLQPGLLLFLYFSGVVLLLGGSALWKRSAFALCLLLFVNPVPHAFTTMVDYPLQHLSAEVARRFAHLLGLYPTGKELQLMFTPKFGMEIIPGCNGMRGAATMAYVALLLTYLRGYRPVRIALAVAGAALLGYLLNFLRLCLLVLYYAIGRNHPMLRGDGVLIDYIIGGCLFLIVSTLAGALWLGGHIPSEPDAPEKAVAWPLLLRRPFLLATAVFLAAASVMELPAAYAVAKEPSSITAPEKAFHQMPLKAGGWTRGNSYSTEVLDGVPRWVWADYRSEDGRTVGLGIWLMPFQHFAIQSRQAHGVEASWQGSMEATAAHGVPVQLSSYIVRDDLESGPVGPTYFSETTCMADRCAGRASGFGRQGLSIAIGPAAMRTQLRLPLQFRVLHPAGEVTLTPAERATDEAAIADLLSNLDTKSLTAQLGLR